MLDSLADACELDNVMLVNTNARKKDKISMLLNNIKTIAIRSQNDLISITNILSLFDSRASTHRQTSYTNII